jgi:hypothetical protein
MASKVGIANLALILLGEKVISSFTQGTPAANFVAARYDDVRDELLRQHNWSFAASRIKLARNTTAPVFGFNYSYAMPADWIKTEAVFDNDSGLGSFTYKVVGMDIETNAENVWMSYIRRVTDPNQMPPDFRAALSHMLAVEGSIALSDNSSLRDRLLPDMERKIRRARSTDALGDDPGQLATGSWIGRRWGSR